jgi:DNA-binding CsgD family transcriptional regulator
MEQNGQNEIIEICDRLNNAGKKDIKPIMSDACKLLGWDYYGFITHVVTSFTKSKVLVSTNYPLSWLAIYKIKSHYETDPVVAHCLRSNLAMIWTADEESWTHFNPKVKAFMGDCRRFGWTGGVGIPIHTHHHHGIFHVTTKKPFIGRAQEILNARLYGPVIGVHLFEALAKNNIQDKVKLSDREHQVLQFVADGYSSKMIADSLRLSESTVVFHITNAQKKIGAKTRQELVTKAYARGLLSIDVHWGDQSILNWPEVDERLASISTEGDKNLLN